MIQKGVIFVSLFIKIRKKQKVLKQTQSMDILFDDTSSKKKGKKSGLFAAKNAGFAKSKEKKPVLNLFGDGDLFDKPKKEKNKSINDLFQLSNEDEKNHISDKKENQKETPKKDPEAEVNAFLSEHPEIEPFIHIQPFTELGLTEDEIHQKISTAATEGFVRVKQCSPLIVSTTEQVEKSYAKINKKYPNRNIPPGCSFRRKGLYALQYTLRVKRNNLIKKNLDKISDCILFIGNLVNIFATSKIDKELKIMIPQIESAITKFPETDEKYNKLTRLIKLVDKFVQEPEQIDCSFNQINTIVSKMFNPTAGYFPDLGYAEHLFNLSLNQFSTEEKQLLEKRIKVSLGHPNAIGKAILTESNEYAKHFGIDPNSSLQVIFILFTRYFFSQLYITNISQNLLKADNTEFISRVNQLRNFSPIGFGFSGNFLPEHLKPMALKIFPKDNPYKEAIGYFELLQFQICPIDFCKVVHDALKMIQAVASEISFQIKTKANGGKVYAKSDHLLCLDDLFDISLIVLLLAAPVNLASMVEQFEPFIQSLEMTAELEFAFTNISAMVRHILELDIEKFEQEAKKRSDQDLEIDPLRILA